MKILKPKKLHRLLWMLTENLPRHYWYKDFLKRQCHIKNIQKDEHIIFKSKDINMNDGAFSSSRLEPIIVPNKNHVPDIKYVIYYPNTK